jgi:hypothetical protein
MFALNDKRKKIPLPKQEQVTTTINLDTVKHKFMRGDLTKEEREKVKKERRPKNSDFFEVKRKIK